MSTIPVLQMKRLLSPLDAAVKEAAAKLLTLQMTHISGEADEVDAQNLVMDLEAIWSIIDPMIEAVGNYAASNFNGIDKSQFTSQLQGALEGNATHEILSAGEKIVADRREEMAEAV